MLSSASTVNAKPALPPAAPAPAAPPAPTGGVSFADYLSQQPPLPPPTAAPAPKEPAAKSADGDAKTPEPATATQASAASGAATQRRKDATKTADKPADGTARPAEADAQATEGREAQAIGQTTDDDTPTDSDAATDPLAELTQLIGLTSPGTATQAAASDAASAKADASAPDLGRGREARITRGALAQDEGAESRPTPGSDRRGAEAGARAHENAQSARAKALDLAGDKTAAATRSPGTDALQASAARNTETSAARPAAVEGATPAFAAVLAQALPKGPAAAESTASPATGRVAAALHSQGFGPELAASVSLLAVDGVQKAELQLNPADMGPVAVQIVVDGAQAQVSFHAVQAETRQALEQSLPDLAAALQGQGLTLAGGGVFQQAPRDAQGGNDKSGASERSSRVAGVSGERDTGGATSVTVTRRASGLLDTFA